MHCRFAMVTTITLLLAGVPAGAAFAGTALPDAAAEPDAASAAAPGMLSRTRARGGEAARFVLTTRLLGKVARANSELLTLRERDPDALPGLPLGREDSIEQAVRWLEAAPRARKAITASGLSLRDYVLAHAAIRQAKLLVEVGRRGERPDPSDPEFPHANVAFVTNHPSEVDALVAQWSTLEDPAGAPGTRR